MIQLQPRMRPPFFALFLLLVICSCENASFDKDKRQITAKNVIREQLHAAKNFDILRFKEDTLETWTDTTFRRPIRYTLNFIYTDSTGAVQNKTGEVLFAPDGKSMITAQINNPNQ